MSLAERSSSSCPTPTRRQRLSLPRHKHNCPHSPRSEMPWLVIKLPQLGRMKLEPDCWHVGTTCVALQRELLFLYGCTSAQFGHQQVNESGLRAVTVEGTLKLLIGEALGRRTLPEP